MTMILTNSLVQFVDEYQAAIVIISNVALMICLLQQQRRRVAAANAEFIAKLRESSAERDESEYSRFRDCTRFHFTGDGEMWADKNGEVLFDTCLASSSKDVADRGICSN
ncbi:MULTISPECIES: hypothetical protein [unclassified Oleiphilus]|uniref:hypothetical protein n=1 Tax=unclassified Oleiphilus TaxID=2631174 RepID=UPI0007C3134E|nr:MULTISPECIES: hypothetical protein [unclassified Oleiphilus]KZY65612.1 hypothetical protein A3738_08290 [Oleiphilus sp. HI0066]KZY71916.1 hypothetical protein A3739_03800 [Oleiphilus sp. HI0067]